MYYSAENVAFADLPVWADCIQVTDILYNQILDEMQGGRKLSSDVNGQPITLAPPSSVEPTKQEVLTRCIKQLNVAYCLAVTELRDTYPRDETNTWVVQLEEARRYRKWEDDVTALGAEAAGPEPTVQFLTDLSNNRDLLGVGTGLSDLVSRILYNNTLYSPAMGFLTARRHYAEQQMYIAFNTGGAPEIEAVTWDFAYYTP